MQNELCCVDSKLSATCSVTVQQESVFSPDSTEVYRASHDFRACECSASRPPDAPKTAKRSTVLLNNNHTSKLRVCSHLFGHPLVVLATRFSLAFAFFLFLFPFLPILLIPLPGFLLRQPLFLLFLPARNTQSRTSF